MFGNLILNKQVNNLIKILNMLWEEELVKKCVDQTQNHKLVSLPLEFAYLAVDILSKQFTKLNSPHEHRIHYLGPRYTNTQTMHKKCSYSQLSSTCGVAHRKISKYPLDTKRITNSLFINEKLRTNHFYKTGLYYRAFQGMNPTLDLSNEIIFNGSFESANLDCVIKVKTTEYDLFLRIDSNTRGHLQWFYFSVANGHHIQKIRINICNISKPGTFYQHLMQPYILSKRQFESKNQGWTQGSTRISNLSFTQKPFNYRILDQKIETPSYCYSFDYQFHQKSDQVYFAYCIPYTYSQLLTDIPKLSQKLVKRYSLGKSLTGLDIPLLHISNHEDHLENLVQKKNILITGRIHPGESNGSHVLNGFIRYLCSDDKNAQDVRRVANFFIVPMINPDGVVLGNSRCSASGMDLNRIFLNSDRQLFPQIYNLKAFTANFLTNKQILMYLDFHGHSRKKNTFFYGPVYPVSHPNYLKCRILPRIIQKLNSGFRYHSCMYFINGSKKSTGRATMFQNFQIPFTYTVESSIGYYYDSQQKKSFSFDMEAYQKIGAHICEGTAIFVTGLEEYDRVIRERRAEREKRKNMKGQIKKTDNKLNFQEDCLFVRLLQEVKTLSERSVKNDEEADMDKQVSSDDHDEKEDFEKTKLKQFNNLIIQNARKDNLMIKLSESQNENVKMFIKSGRLSKKKNTNSNPKYQKNRRIQDDQEELNFLEQLEERMKPKSSQTSRVIKTGNMEFSRDPNKIIRKKTFSFDQNEDVQKSEELERKVEFTKFPFEEDFIFSQKHTLKLRSSILCRSKTGKKPQKKEEKEKNMHFAGMHFPDQDKFQERRLLRHQKTDLLRRNIQRRKQKQQQSPRPKKTNPSQPTISTSCNNPQPQQKNMKKKRINQFKIQQIMSNMQFRSKMLKQSVKYHQTPQLRMKMNSMFPSSFYSMRQQLYTKKRNCNWKNQSKSVDGQLVITVKQFNV